MPIPFSAADLQARRHEMSKTDMLFPENFTGDDVFNKWNASRRIKFNTNDEQWKSISIPLNQLLEFNCSRVILVFLAIYQHCIPAKHFLGVASKRGWYETGYRKLINDHIQSDNLSQKYRLQVEKTYRMLYGGYKEHEFLTQLYNDVKNTKIDLYNGIDIDLLQDTIGEDDINKRITYNLDKALHAFYLKNHKIVDIDSLNYARCVNVFNWAYSYVREGYSSEDSSSDYEDVFFSLGELKKKDASIRKEMARLGWQPIQTKKANLTRKQKRRQERKDARK